MLPQGGGDVYEKAHIEREQIVSAFVNNDIGKDIAARLLDGR